MLPKDSPKREPGHTVTTMLRRLLAMLVIATGVAVFTPAVADARAPDRRPCVSLREYERTNIPLRRRQLEKRWEVTGLGVTLTEHSNLWETAVAYRACGYTMEDGYVQIWYDNRVHHWQAMMYSVATGVEPHGHVRTR